MFEATVSRAKYISKVPEFGIPSRNSCREERKNKEVDILPVLLIGVYLPLEWFKGFICRWAILGSNIAKTGIYCNKHESGRGELVMHAYNQILGQERIPGFPSCPASRSIPHISYLLGPARRKMFPGETDCFCVLDVLRTLVVSSA